MVMLSFSATRKILNGVRLTVGQIRSLGIAHSVVPMTEARVEGVKTAWFTEMAPRDRQAAAVWPALWKTNVPAITHEFMYKVLWKKL